MNKSPYTLSVLRHILFYLYRKGKVMSKPNNPTSKHKRIKAKAKPITNGLPNMDGSIRIRTKVKARPKTPIRV